MQNLMMLKLFLKIVDLSPTIVRHVYFVEKTLSSNLSLKSCEDNQTNTAGMVKSDNVYGNIIEDAWRRDITINALYLQH